MAVPEQRVMGYQKFTGRTEAVESVEIRARVSGVLVRETFEAGPIVRKGQLLFVIEPDPYVARKRTSKPGKLSSPAPGRTSNGSSRPSARTL